MTIVIEELTDIEKAELMTTFACMVLSDSKVEMSAENIQKLTDAAGGEVPAHYAKLFAGILDGQDMEQFYKLGGGGGGAAAAPAAGESHCRQSLWMIKCGGV